MEINTKAASELLASVEGQITTLQAELAELIPFRDTLRKFANGSAGGSLKTSDINEVQTQSKAPAQKLNLSDMSRGQAALAILRREESSLTTKEIVERLKQHDVDMSNKHAPISLTNALARLARQRILRKKRTGKGSVWEIADTERAEQALATRSLPRGNRKTGQPTYGDVCADVLKKAGHKLHIDEFFEPLAAAGLHPKRATLSSGLTRDSKERFVNTGGNTFALKEWQASK